METKGYNIFAELGLSCFNINSYKTIRKNKFGKRFLYHLILTILVFGISYGISYAKFVSETGGMQGLIEQYVPDFEVTENGYLEMDETFSMAENGILIMADTDAYFAYDDEGFFIYDELAEDWVLLGTTEEYQSVALLDYEKAILYTNTEGDQEMYYNELVEMTGSFNRQSVVDMCNSFIPIVAIFLFVWTFLAIWWGVFVSSLILLAISSIMGGTKLPYMELYTISLYASTPFRILFAIISLLSVAIPFKGLLLTAAIAIYSAVIVNKIKKDSDTGVSIV